MLKEAGQNIVLSSLDHGKILRSLGIFRANVLKDPEANARLQNQILECETEVLRIASPKAVLRVLPVEDVLPVFPGKDIARLLDGCIEAVLMALTLGIGLEKRLMREEVSNMSNAYMLDVCASQAVEEAADLLEKRIRSQVRSENRFLTNRYSPGYGDFPLKIQRLLLNYLNAERAIGLTLTPTNLMVPRKSVTAVMGISDLPRPDVYGSCTHCPLLSKCSFREHGERCYS